MEAIIITPRCVNGTMSYTLTTCITNQARMKNTSHINENVTLASFLKSYVGVH